MTTPNGRARLPTTRDPAVLTDYYRGLQPGEVERRREVRRLINLSSAASTSRQEWIEQARDYTDSDEEVEFLEYTGFLPTLDEERDQAIREREDARRAAIARRRAAAARRDESESRLPDGLVSEEDGPVRNADGEWTLNGRVIESSTTRSDGQVRLTFADGERQTFARDRSGNVVWTAPYDPEAGGFRLQGSPELVETSPELVAYTDLTTDQLAGTPQEQIVEDYSDTFAFIQDVDPGEADRLQGYLDAGDRRAFVTETAAYVSRWQEGGDLYEGVQEERDSYAEAFRQYTGEEPTFDVDQDTETLQAVIDQRQAQGLPPVYSPVLGIVPGSTDPNVSTATGTPEAIGEGQVTLSVPPAGVTEATGGDKLAFAASWLDSQGKTGEMSPEQFVALMDQLKTPDPVQRDGRFYDPETGRPAASYAGLIERQEARRALTLAGVLPDDDTIEQWGQASDGTGFTMTEDVASGQFYEVRNARHAQLRRLIDGTDTLDDIPPADRAGYEQDIAFYQYTGELPAYIPDVDRQRANQVLAGQVAELEAQGYELDPETGRYVRYEPAPASSPADFDEAGDYSTGGVLAQRWEAWLPTQPPRVQALAQTDPQAAIKLSRDLQGGGAYGDVAIAATEAQPPAPSSIYEYSPSVRLDPPSSVSEYGLYRPGPGQAAEAEQPLQDGTPDYAVAMGSGIRTATDYERFLRDRGLKDWQVHQLVGQAVRDGRVIDDGVLVDGMAPEETQETAGPAVPAPDPLRRAGGTVAISSYEIGAGTGPEPVNVRPRLGEVGYGGEQLYPGPEFPAQETAEEIPAPRGVNEVEDQWERLETEGVSRVAGYAGSVDPRPITAQLEKIREDAAFRNEHAVEINEALKRPDYIATIQEGQQAIQADPNAIEPTTGERWTVVMAAVQGRVNDIDAMDPEVLAYAARIQGQMDESNVPAAVRYGNVPGISRGDAEAAAVSPYSDGGFKVTDREAGRIRAGEYTAVVDSVALGINAVSVPRLTVAAARGIGNVAATRSVGTAGRSIPGNVADELAEEQTFQLLYVPAGGSPLLNPFNVVEGAGIATESGAQSLAAAAGRRGYRTGLPFDDQPPPVTASQLLPVTYSGRPYGLITPGDPTPTRFTPYGTAFYSGGKVDVMDAPVTASPILPPFADSPLIPTRPEHTELAPIRAPWRYEPSLPGGASFGGGYASGYSTSTRLREVTTPSGLRVIVPVEDDQPTIQPEGEPQLELQEQTLVSPGVAPAQQPAVAPITTPEIVQAPQPALAPVPAVGTSTQTLLQAQTARQEGLAVQPRGLIVTQPVPAKVPAVSTQTQTLTQTQTQQQAQTARQQQWVRLPNGLVVPAVAVSTRAGASPATVASLVPQLSPAITPALSPAVVRSTPRIRTITRLRTPVTVTARSTIPTRVNVDGPGTPGESPLSPADKGSGYPAKAEFLTLELNQVDFQTGEVNEVPVSNDHRQTLRVTERTRQDTRGRNVDTGGVSVGVDRTGRARVTGENQKTTKSSSGDSNSSGKSPFYGGGGRGGRRRRSKDNPWEDDRAYGATGAPVVRIVAK